MSNRSLLEFNHDYFDRIRDNPEAFVAWLKAFLNNADSDSAERLKTFGVTWHGTRHHSEPSPDRIKSYDCQETIGADGKCSACGWNTKTRSYEKIAP